MGELLSLFLNICLISITSYSGSVQTLFYEVGVHRLQWITNQDYINYLGFGFASPGPQVFSLATFMGFSVASWVGAVVGTIAIYLIPTILAIAAGRYLQSWIQKKHTQYFIQAVGLAAAGLLVSVAIKIIGGSELSVTYLLIAGGAAIAINKKVSPLFIIIAGLLAGLTLS